MKRGIIFDMDGTLWDSAENVAKSWNVAIRQYGVREKELTTQDIQGVMGKTMDVIADILFAEFPEEKRRLLLKECCQVENDYLRERSGAADARGVEAGRLSSFDCQQLPEGVYRGIP